MEGQRKALGVDDGLIGEQTITVNYPGLDSLCRNPEFFTSGEDVVIDVPDSDSTSEQR